MIDMEALDLSKKPPRSPWVKVGGAFMLARTIDKLRASLPGGNMGVYRIPGFSEALLRAIGAEEEELRGVVARAANDDEVAAWVTSRADPARLERYNDRSSKRTIADVEDKQDFFRRYPGTEKLALDTPLFDALDKDDAQMFAG